MLASRATMRRVLVTSALPYINGIKHLGNLVGSLLPADIYARFLRQKGVQVIFICGTDEHGAPAEIAADAERVPVDAYCERMFRRQQITYEQFSLSFDYFGRSSAPENHQLTRDIFLRLYQNGHISEADVVQLYDRESDRFLPDRFVEGICPHCGFDGARGDQCDNCTKLLDAVDLIDPRSGVSGSRNLERRATRQLFLRLPAFAEPLGAWIRARRDRWSTTSVSIAEGWLREGLHDRCISRDLRWGIPVPLAGFEDKVFYVWFDAPNAYIAITQAWAASHGRPDAWADYWKDPRTEVVQFMAKDNVPFHTIIWPSMLMGADAGYVLPDRIKGFEYLNFEGGKFSTSQRRGVFLDDAIALFPADYWRFYLMSIVPERSDSDFRWTGFQQSVGTLADTFGNFVHRTLTFLTRYYDAVVPRLPATRETDARLWAAIAASVEEADRALESLNFTAWVRALREVWSEGNRYLDAESPWATRKTSPADAEAALYHGVHLCRAMAVLSSPLVPSLAQRVFDQLQLAEDPARLSWTDALRVPAFEEGHRIAPSIAPLCPKIDEARLNDVAQRFESSRT
jgi:methionyl-tRNA synthetase